ncbi:MAG: hypothetical protein QOF33_1601 [Thermomicrobiales bacterium]|jgi:predicted nucleic acid-binding protein|nr:hypothetical protein [Thermomicrobiales bacterium]
MTATHSREVAVFVDTGAYAALALTSDANHRRALATALERRRAFLCTTNWVVAETYALILARAGRTAAISILDRFEQSPDLIVRVAEDDERRAYEIVRHYQDKTFSLVDATSFAVMERLGMTEAFTFTQYGFRVVESEE